MDSTASNPLSAVTVLPESSRKRHRNHTSEAGLDAPENRRKDPKVSRACDSCKTKKIRCSGTLPCETCSRRGLDCAYASKYARGKPPTPPSLADAEQPVGKTQIHRELATDAAGAGSCSASSTPIYPAQTLTPTGSIGQDVQAARGSPELVIEGQYFDLTSGLTFLHRAWGKLSAQSRRMEYYGSNEAERNQLLTSAGDRPFYLDERGTEGIFPDDSTALSLVRLFFDTCVVTYRMFHLQTVEAWLDTLLANRLRNNPISHTLGNAKCAILYIIVAIASFRLSKLQGTSSADNEPSALRQSDRLFCAAMEHANSEMGFPRLESAQARLIQVLYLLQTSRMNKGWYTFGNAYQIVSSLGLHRRQARKLNASFWGRPDYITVQCEKRTFWVAYTIDKYLSVVFGRPRLFHDDEIDQDFPDSVNDEDMGPDGPFVLESSEECHIDSLISHAKIAQIIGRISRNVYCIGEAGNTDQVSSAHRLVNELHAWRASLPAHLGTVKPSTLIPSFRREATALNLAYAHAVIHATRPFLLGNGISSSDEPEVQNGILECISAARRVLELVNTMANDKNLFHSFWWTQYVLFCALAVVYLWEIQQSASENNQLDKSYASLFILAEKCRSYLLQGSFAAPPNHRYGVILEELRLEAQQVTLRNKHPCPIQPSPAGIRNGTNAGAGSLNGSQMPEAGTEMIAIPDNTPHGFPSMLDAWQTTDWLDLDSSALYPILDAFDT